MAKQHDQHTQQDETAQQPFSSEVESAVTSEDEQASAQSSHEHEGIAQDETAHEQSNSSQNDEQEDTPSGRRQEPNSSDAKANDVTTPAAVVVGGKNGGWFHRLRTALGAHKAWTSVAGVVVVFAVLASVPWTRYKIAGLFLKQTVSIVVSDSQTSAPVTSASVSVAGVHATTDNHGVAKLHVRVGSSAVMVAKTYYQTHSFSTVVPILKPKHSITASLVATGRQVPVTVINKISGKPLENAEVKAAGSTAKTDVSGKAIVVLPPNAKTVSATITADGYNNGTAGIQVTTASVAANTFSLTPNGQLYFLSNLSGKIDVVKTNLDGTGRQTVLAASGFEDPNNTSLLASRDWKYLALYSIRTSGANAQLNLIDATSGDKLSNIDEGATASFTPVGWDGDDFIYTVRRNDIPNWQPNQSALKSFNAQTGKITVLDQTTGSGTNGSDYLQSVFGSIYILNGSVVYATGWECGYYATTNRAGQHSATLTSIQPDGSAKKVLQSFGAAVDIALSTEITTIPYEANGLYIQAPNGTFYTFEDGAVKPNTTLTGPTFYNQPYSTYLLSPSGNQTFWSVAADGKNNLLVGNNNGDNGKQIATLSDYSVYGWYSDNYLLVSKNSSELYVMPAAGGTPLKVSDYYKPARSFYGYGSGYGGL